MRRSLSQMNTAAAGAILIAAVCVIRFFVFGARYFPVLDDYIQILGFSENTVSAHWQYVVEAGNLGYRTLAHLSEIPLARVYALSPLIPFVFYELMFAASGLIFWKVFRKRFGCGMIFPLLFLLTPTSFEGYYWMSAADRIVPGLFFTALALLLLEKWFEKKRVGHALLFLVLQLVSLFFYEQVFLVSYALVAFFAFMEGCRRYRVSVKKREPHRVRRIMTLWAPVVLCLANAVIYFAFTSQFASAATNRSTVTDLSLWYFKNYVPSMNLQVWRVFLTGTKRFITEGFSRAFSLLSVWQIVFIAGLSVSAVLGVVLMARRMKEDEESGGSGVSVRVWGIFCGLFVFAFAVLPFYIFTSTWISFRNALPAFVGVALLCDCVFSLVFIKAPEKIYKAVSITALSGLAVIFMFSCSSLLYDYKITYDTDQIMIKNVRDMIQDGPDAQNVYLIGAPIAMADEQAFFFHEQIHNITESSWALTGSVRAYGGYQSSWFVPVSYGRVYDGYDDFSSATSIYGVRGDLSLVPLIASENDGIYSFRTKDGILFASAAKREDGWYLEGDFMYEAIFDRR